MKIYFCISLFIIIGIHSACNSTVFNRNLNFEDKQFWIDNGMNFLKSRLDLLDEGNVKSKAENIILFLGDGMGMPTITAGRIYKGQINEQSGEEASLVFDDFPYIGLAKTYNVNKQVPDSAGTATAIFTGVKTAYGVVGMDNRTTAMDAETGKLDSFLKWAQNVGKRTGIVTTTRITHATPAATYASIYNRDWECDVEIPDESSDIYKDIARQLVENEPGINFNVIFGGGLKPMGNTNLYEASDVRFEGPSEEICNRMDGKNLVEDWLNLPGENRKFVQNRDDLMNLDVNGVSHVMGLFRNNHLTYALARQVGEPSLSEMVEQAIRVLSSSENGFVLMIEGGRIDQAHHQNYAHAALEELVEFDAAIDVAMRLTNRKNTLIIVTADHSHSMSFNGYPERGNNILDFANDSETFAYETISYSNGPGFYNHRANLSTSYINSTWNARYDTWVPVEEIDPAIRASPTYRNFAAFPLSEETHGGEDVPVYAIGPGAQLIGGVFEQSYLAYVMSYMGCMGPAKDLDKTCNEYERSPNSSTTINKIEKYKLFSFIFVLFSFNLLFLY